jgi:lipopolysaccharide/colanic/teichoic acid biosynthesis glycosyltransferase
MSLVSEMSQSETERSVTGPQILKSRLDSVLALVLMVLTAPLMGLAALLVYLTSPGPVIYRQTRLGLHGRRYTIYKIRSMYHDCERHTGARWSLPGDKRVTWIGKILRATHIDELPQLWNILKGDMSLVGPRPERPEIVVGLELAIPCYRDRLEVRPGVTGLAQVQLPPDTDLESVRRKVAYDLYYIEHASLWLDIRLIVATALGILRVPPSFTSTLLAIPDADRVERAYRDRSGEMDTIPQGVEPLPHANLA